MATASAIGNTACQTSQIVGFVTGAVVVATVGSYRTLGIDTLSFGISALILMTALRARPAPQRATGKRATMWLVSADSIRIVFGDQAPRALLLFGWLTGFYILPRACGALRAPAGGTEVTVGLPLATVIGLAMSWAQLRGKVIADQRS